MMTIYPPVRPWRGTRNTDSWGSGVYGASRDGGNRAHMGTDFISVPGDEVVAPFPGFIRRLGLAYAGSSMGSLHIEGDGIFEGWWGKLLYVGANKALLGRHVEAGDVIGTAQDVAAYWAAQKPEHVGLMTNHVHLEIIVTSPRNVDPTLYLPQGMREVKA